MSDLPIEDENSKSSSLKQEVDEDLSDLLDEALQDFDQQPSCSFKTSKNDYKGAKSSSPSKKSKSKNVNSQEKENKSFQNDGIFGNINHSSSNQTPLNASNSIPSEKELEDMFNDLMKSASLEQGRDGNNPEVQNVLPMMENMMHSLLSFEVLYPPLKELCNKYPEWLAENRASLKIPDYDKYNKQFEVTLQLCQEFEKHQSLKESKTNISEDIQQKHFEIVFELMQKMQSYGNPPADIVGEFGAIPYGSDSSNIQHEEERFKSFLAQNGLDTSGEKVQLDANGVPMFPKGFSGNEEQCIIS